MRVTTAEFIKNYGSLADKALMEPVTITKTGRACVGYSGYSADGVGASNRLYQMSPRCITLSNDRGC